MRERGPRAVGCQYRKCSQPRLLEANQDSDSEGSVDSENSEHIDGEYNKIFLL